MNLETIYPWLESGESEKKPEAPSWLIDNVAELSKYARTIHLIYIGFMVYCALTILSTTDRNIVLDEKVHLPIANVDLRFAAFVTVVPVVAILLFIYMYVQLQALIDYRKTLRTNYALQESRLYPWVTSIVAEPEPGLSGILQRLIINLSLWWLLPVVLILFTFAVFKKHDPRLSWFVWGLSFTGTLLVLWLRYLSDYGRPRVELSGGPRLAAVRRFLGHWGRLARFAFVVIGIHAGLLTGILMIYKYGQYAPFTVYLPNQILVTEQKEEYGTPWVDLEGVHLEEAWLNYTILKHANLKNANLQGASLSVANLQKASLFAADLKEANFDDAKLEEADFSFAVIQGVSFVRAHLQKAQFKWLNTIKKDPSDRKTDFTAADLRGAEIWRSSFGESADFEGANLEGAEISSTGLGKANFKDANLSNAKLWGNDFRDADFAGANLEGANLFLTDLRGARSLTVEQLSRARTLFKANLDSTLIDQITERFPNLLGPPDKSDIPWWFKQSVKGPDGLYRDFDQPYELCFGKYPIQELDKDGNPTGKISCRPNDLATCYDNAGSVPTCSLFYYENGSQTKEGKTTPRDQKWHNAGNRYEGEPIEMKKDTTYYCFCVQKQ